MLRKQRFLAIAVCGLLAAALGTTGFSADQPRLKTLIVDGQNNHNWARTTPVLKNILEQTGRFQVDVATSPPKGQPMDNFKPDFSRYNVVVMNYAGDDWAEPTKKAFEEYVRSGGGLVIYHAANNAFPDWKEYNEMIALGGWGNRDEKAGPYVHWRDGKMVLDADTPGKAGAHGPQHEFPVVIRDREHLITKGLPETWMHVSDELYNHLRGPAKNMTILATAYSPPEMKGIGEHEPALFTVSYGKGRVFQTILGHDAEHCTCVGFVVTFQRGAEWAATGNVTLTEVPKDFPTAEKTSVRESLLKGVPPRLAKKKK